MRNRVLLALVGAAVFGGISPMVLESRLDATESKLNYYRVPGGDPFCGDPCDGAACCTTPGGGEEVT